MGRRRISPRLRANRSNARKSSGPRTLSGKEISSMNAIIHGLSAKRVSVSCDPEVDRFASQLCGSDKSETALYLAHEIAEAQFELNAVRAYKMILRHLHAVGKDSPFVQPPFYEPVICGFTKMVSGTGGRMPRA